MPSRVSIVNISEDIDTAVRKAVELAGGLELDSGERILIKPNMSCGKPSGSGLVTNVDVVAAVVRLVREHCKQANVLVADLPICGWDPEETYRVIGIREAVEKAGGTFVDLAKTEMVRVKLPRASKLTKVTLAKLALEVDGIIDVPVIKTHFMTGHTGAIKNLKGLTRQDQRTRMHVLGLHEPVVDLFEHLLPQVRYCIVDGTVAADAVRPSGPYQGPTAGTPVELNVILAGRDPVAVDATIARLMGFKPEKLSILKIASERELGELDDIEIVGDAAETFKRLRGSRRGGLISRLQALWTSRVFNRITHGLVRRWFGSEIVTRKTAKKEMDDDTGEGVIEVTDACNGCGLCVKACKLGNITLQEGKPLINMDHCVRCWICCEACPEAALLIRSKMIRSVDY
ncbi:MAG: DUF362 domain-containing protein [Promethearchaeota archaeon]